ncbi:MAG TPA: hydroxymyristoyl-ACP dehydratase [Caldimonas sp.]|jgi:predicted hotdog family 3-hydroxylacyl-ACP dehydratase|nr:hydroxymyristoyl-ACP dehydratase [Caldimonas sp.]HEX2542673.1 hydroxymyristoyl-ACP dehydratase [Caldimonas sp.]
MTAADRAPATLDRDGIAARIPHRGPMCLLGRMTAWDATSIECVALNHRDRRHPLRTRSGLLASAAIEYAAQAMALHGALAAAAAGGEASPGFLASARDVRLAVWRLDDLPPVEPDVLLVSARRQAADAERILYSFSLAHGGRTVATGRLAVVLNTAPAGAS